MKFRIFLLSLLLSLNVFANDERVLKYSCLMNKSETLNVYSVGNEISLGLEHFLYGESEIFRMRHPNIVDYGGVFMALENYGRSGYFFIRFEDGKKASENDIGNSLGMIDDNRFNIENGLGFERGGLSVLANCKKVN